jgi:hypothetical protein
VVSVFGHVLPHWKIIGPLALGPAPYRHNRLGGSVKPEDHAVTMPDLKPIERLLALRRKQAARRDRAFVREPGRLHLDVGNLSIV